MYTAHFGLKDRPFAITPDPGYLYLSAPHQEALAHLLYGTGEDGGFVQLTGEVGTGKTTLVRTLVEQHIENLDIALCLNPRLTVEELVAGICDELGVEYPRAQPTLKSLIDALNAHLLNTHARGRHTVLIIDEAQNLSREVLEQIRLLTNLETHRHKLLRIILVGQPELQRLLEASEMRQLAQRITARYHLMPLSRKETMAYIIHRLRVAGGRDDLFTAAALKAVYRLTGGVPRLVNIICDRALLGAYSRGLLRVDSATVRRAAGEALHGRTPGLRWRPVILGGVLAGLTVAAVAFHLPRRAELFPLPWLAAAPPAVTVAETTLDESPAPPETAASPPVRDLSPQALESLLFAADADPLARLLGVWGEEPVIPSGTNPCEYVNNYNLRCLSGRAGWAELRRYNRPAILNLISPQGDIGQAVLRSLEGDAAIMDIAGQSVRVDLARLEPLWTGDYLMFWRPQIASELIGPGARGEPVTWLRRRLALAEGKTPSREPPAAVFDQALRVRVQDFQRANDLAVDGLVGERTMALLNNQAPAPGTPLLIPGAGSQVN